MNWELINWELIKLIFQENQGFIQFVLTIVTSIAAIILALIVWTQVRVARIGRLELLWDNLLKSASEEVEELKGKEKIKDLSDINEKKKIRRKRHLYIERLEEALRIEKPSKLLFLDKDLKKMHKRLKRWYWKALNVYEDGGSIQVFEEVKIWHDYSKGELDPVEIGFRILNFLADGKKEEEELVKEFSDVFEKLKIENNLKKEAEQGLKERLRDLESFGFINCKGKLTCKKYWELSKEGKEVIKGKVNNNTV